MNGAADTGRLEADALSVRAGARTLVESLSFTLAAGEFLAVLGGNGSGKSLLLHTLAGLRPPAAGRVSWRGAPLASLGRRAVAREIALLLQDQESTLPLTALESVLIGRHPHLDLWRSESEADRAIAREALAEFDIGTLADRGLASLSGGEQRRVALAAVLAQQPRVFLLDEPANHLDPRQQQQTLALMRARCHEGASCIATLHDAAQADRHADRVLLLYGDGRWRIGPTQELLGAESLAELYGMPIAALGAPGRRAFLPG